MSDSDSSDPIGIGELRRRSAREFDEMRAKHKLEADERAVLAAQAEADARRESALAAQRMVEADARRESAALAAKRKAEADAQHAQHAQADIASRRTAASSASSGTHRQHRAVAEVVDASGAKPLMPAPTPQPLPPPSPDDDRSIDNPASGQTSKRARGGDVPPVMKRVIEERERQERELETAKQLDRDRADAARRQSYVHPSMLPLTNRPIADLKHTKVLSLEFKPQLEIADKCSAFIEIRSPPPLYYGHQDAFTHSAAIVRSVVGTLGPNANIKIGVTKQPAHTWPLQ